MEKDKNKNQSILTKNNVDSNKKENETPIKSDNKKSESENIIIKNKSIDNTSSKIFKKETNSNPIEQKLLNNNYNSNSFNHNIIKKDTDHELPYANKNKRIYLPFTRDKKVYMKNNLKINSVLHPSKHMFENSYNLDDIYNKNNELQSSKNNNIKIDISQDNEESQNAIIENNDNNNNNNNNNEKEENSKYHIKFRNNLNLTDNSFPEQQNNNVILLKEQFSQPILKLHKFINKDNNITTVNKYAQKSVNSVNLEKNSYEDDEKNDKKPKKNLISNYNEKEMKEKLFNIDDKILLKEKESVYLKYKQISNDKEKNNKEINKEKLIKVNINTTLKEHPKQIKNSSDENNNSSFISNNQLKKEKIGDGKDKDSISVTNDINDKLPNYRKFKIISPVNNYSINSFNSKYSRYRNNNTADISEKLINDFNTNTNNNNNNNTSYKNNIILNSNTNKSDNKSKINLENNINKININLSNIANNLNKNNFNQNNNTNNNNTNNTNNNIHKKDNEQNKKDNNLN